MRQEALRCAAAGLRVHPLYEVGDDLVCRCHKGAACDEKARGKHPRLPEWQKAATNDARHVDAWWSRWPNAGIGIATGSASRVWVLDLDGDAAIEWYRSKSREHGLTKTIGVKTGRGRHLWWEWPDGAEIRNSGGKISPGVDVRGEGGFVIAPSTLHRSGVRYEWLTTGAYIDHPAPTPAWLLELVRYVAPTPPPPRPPRPATMTPREISRAFRDAVDTDPDVRQRIGERAGGRVRPAGKTYVDQLPCPKCGRRDAWFYVDSGPAVCHHRKSCGWAGPITKILEIA